jgi:hypothetical protein
MSNYEQPDLFQIPKESTSSPALTLVNRFPLPARSKAKKIRATSGPKFIDSLEMTGYVQCTFLERTLVDILDKVLTPYVRTWSVVVTDGGVSVLKQRVSGRITEDKESGGSQKTRTMIPTATASDHIERESTSTETMNPMTGKSVSLDRFVKFWPTEEIQKSGKPNMWSTPTAFDHTNISKPRKNHPGGGQKPPLQQQVKMWPTPRVKGEEKLETLIKRKGIKKAVQHNLHAAVEMWPTPMGRDYKGGRKPETLKKAGRNPSNSLPDAVTMWPTPSANEDAAGQPGTKMQKMLGNHPEVRGEGIGTLNPTWVEWLMGFPIGYTDLKHSETQ